MKFQNRLVMGLLGIVLAAAGVFLLGIYAELFDVAGTGLEGMMGLTEAAVAGAILFLLGLVLLLLSIASTGGAGEKKSSTRSIVQYNEIGEIRVSLVAVENMVLRVSRQVKGIRDTETRVDYNEHGLLVYVKVKVLPDLQIPQLVTELQQNIKDYVEDLTGTAVVEVKAMVENIAAEQVAPRKK